MLLILPNPGPRLVDRFGAIVRGLREAIAQHAAQRPDRAAVVAFLCGYLNRAIARFERIANQPRPTGPTPPPAPAEAAASSPRTRPKRPPPPLRLSRKHGWVGQMGHEVRGYGSQLGALLADPELAALIEANPRMVRLLRPLCRMLGVDNLPAVLRPTRREPAPPRAAPPRAPERERVRRPRRVTPRGSASRWDLAGTHPIFLG